MTSRTGNLPETREANLREAMVRKPTSLKAGSVLMPFAPASPAEAARIETGIGEVRRLAFRIEERAALRSEGYFAGSIHARRQELIEALRHDAIDGLVGVRGGYGSNYLLDDLSLPNEGGPKAILGFSDLTSLQMYLWRRARWVTFYGPMLAAGFDAGPGVAKGYDAGSLLAALQTTLGGWRLELQGEALCAGDAQGVLLGGCLTLVETAIGTPWDLQTAGAILVLEDRGMKPWQVDRALMHLKQAGKFAGVQGIVLGDFPECEAPFAGSPTVREVCERILGQFGVPVVFGAPIGHTQRPMLTVPLGVSAHLSAKGEGVLEILEPAVR